MTRTITPFIIATGNNPYPIATAARPGLSVFSNPATGDLNIQWEHQARGNAVIVLTDAAGNDVYKSAININAASGRKRIGLSGLKDGIYLITIDSDNIYYSGQLLVQQ
jgi:Secretion system C-terminal sorting domain